MKTNLELRERLEEAMSDASKANINIPQTWRDEYQELYTKLSFADRFFTTPERSKYTTLIAHLERYGS